LCFCFFPNQNMTLQLLLQVLIYEVQNVEATSTGYLFVIRPISNIYFHFILSEEALKNSTNELSVLLI